MSGILLNNSVMLDLALAKYRSPQQGPSILPDGLEIISADNHIGLKDDI